MEQEEGTDQVEYVTRFVLAGSEILVRVRVPAKRRHSKARVEGAAALGYPLLSPALRSRHFPYRDWDGAGAVQDVMEKKRIVENDKRKIELVIEELDEKKNQALKTTWTKVC